MLDRTRLESSSAIPLTARPAGSILAACGTNICTIDDTAFKPSRLALLAVRTGDAAEARRILAQLRRETGAATSYQHAEILAQLGDRDGALAELDAAVRRKDSGLAHMKVDPFLDPIRRDPRYATLLRRLKFP